MRRLVTVPALSLIALVTLSGCFGGGAKKGASFLVSTDGGATFTPRVALSKKKTIAGVSVLSMAHVADDNKTIYIGTKKNGIFVTHDGGEQWAKVAFPPKRVYGLAVDPQARTTLYASGVHNKIARVYKSTDEGQQWEEIYAEPTAGAVITALALDPAHPQTIYVGTSKGLIIKSTDGGASWVNLYQARAPITDIAFDANDTQTIYFTLYKEGLLKTRDGGATIKDFTDNVAGTAAVRANRLRNRRSTRIYALATDPHTGGVVYVGTDDGVYRSSDYGVTWKQLDLISSSKNLPVRAIAVNPHNTGQIVYTAGQLLYRSGATMAEWTTVPISAGRTVSVVHYDAQEPGVIYIGLK